MAAESQSHHHQILLHHHHRREPPQRPPPSRGLRSTAGQIVEVQGGHIVRSTGRKDRHSKVCTAKGPRDRRVRLSAHTAIQFYDVQDRLGYDRPSKAVDWLIKNAKAAIDELAELPAWHPTATVVNTDNQENHGGAGGGGETSNRDMHVVSEHGNSSNYHEFGGGDCGGSSSFLPPSLDSDAIADTIKSFFPIAAAAASSSAPSSSSSPIGFQSYPPPDLLSRASSQNQDLRLSLQSFQDPIFHHHQGAAHHQHQHQQNQNAAASHHHSLFSGFDAASMVPWEVAESSSGGGGGGGGGYVFSVPLQQQALAMHHGLSHGHVPGQSQQFFTQRGPLQSSNPPFVRAWAEPMAPAADHQMHHHPAIHHPIGFASGSSSGFSGFRIPARIQGEEEENDGKPSSTSSGSHH